MKLLERLFLLAGAVLFVWLVNRIGLAPILENLRRVGWAFLVLFAFQGAVLILDTLGWRFTLPPGKRTDAFDRMFGMRLAGDSINYLTPTAAMGGEFVRYRLLARTHPPAEALASVALLVVNQFFSQAIFVLAGAPFVYLALGHRALRWGGALASLGVLLALLLGGLVYLGKRGDGIRRLRGFAHRFAPGPLPAGEGGRRPGEGAQAEDEPHPRPLSSLERGDQSQAEATSDDPWQQVDENVFGAYRKRHGDMALSILCFVLAWSVGIGECAVILFLLGVRAPLAAVVAIETLSVLVETALFFVPGKIGTQEGGKYFIFLSLGLNPAAGFSFGLTRRVRELAWALIGLVALAVMQRGGRRRPAKSPRN